jgi:Secretion system C-terminal sorting domain
MIKRILLIAFAALSFSASRAQILTSYDFTGYNGLTSSTASALRTYYSGSGQCGVSCPAYKFNLTGATIISATFSNATQVQFYMKGNGTVQPNNTFNVYSTSNGSTWNLLSAYAPIAQAAATYILPLSASDVQIKFEYIKDSLGYNVGLDDIVVSNGPVGLPQFDKASGFNIYPTMSSGTVYLEGNSVRKNVAVSVVNLIGKEVKNFTFIQANGKSVLSLTDLPEGVYILKVTSTNNQQYTKRIVIKK